MAKLPIMIALIILFITGCTMVPNSALINTTATPGQNSPTAAQPPTPTEATLTPTVETSPTPTPAATTTQAGSTPASPAAPQPPLSPGWQTYIWTEQHIAIDYPPDWTVKLQAGDLVFSSTQQQVIKLSRVAAPGMSPQDYLAASDLPNTRCSTVKNKYGVTARTCLDTIARITTANLVVAPPQGEVIILQLVTHGQNDPKVVDGIIQSIRVAP